MKRQSLVLLAVAFAAAGAAGCFKDPVSGLRSGPSILAVDHTSIYVLAGDSTTVVATIQDNGGNVLPETDATWTSADPAIAVVRKDTTQVIPGNYFSRGFIRGVAALGGVTNVTVATRGLSVTIRVIVIPPLLPSGFAVTGAAVADTVVVPAQAGPPPVPAQTVAYTAGDTLTVNGTAFLNIDTSAVTAYVTGQAGKTQGYIISKTPQQIKVVFTSGAAGKVIVTHWKYVSGLTAVGTQPLDSLILKDTIAIARIRMRGTVAQAGDTVTVTLPAGFAFTSGATFFLGSSKAFVISQTASTAQLLSRVDFNGGITINGVTFAGNTLTGLVPPAATAITAWPGVVSVALVGDSLVVTATGPERFDSKTRVYTGTYQPGLPSDTTTKPRPDSIVFRDSMHVQVISSTASSGVPRVTQALIGSARIDTLVGSASISLPTATVPAAAISQAGDTLTVTSVGALWFDKNTHLANGLDTSATSGAVTTHYDSVFAFDSTHLQTISPSGHSAATIRLFNSHVGSATMTQIRTTGSYTTTKATLPSAVSQVGDTLTITGGGLVWFDKSSGIVVNTTRNVIIAFDSLHLSALAALGSTGTVNLTNGLVGVTRISSLKTAASFTTNTATFPGTITVTGDTVTVAGTAGAVVDSLSSVTFGGTSSGILSIGTNSLNVLPSAANTGPVKIANVLVGIGRITLSTPASYSVTPGHFLGTATQLGDTVTVTAPAGVTFDAQTGLGFGTGTGIILSRTSTTMVALSTALWSGPVVITNALLGSIRVPALTTTTSVSVNASSIPDASVNLGGGKLGDTITVIAPAGMKFSANSMVLAGNTAIPTSDTAWTLSRSADTMIKAFAKRGGTGPVMVTNVIIGSGANTKVLPFLPSASSMTIDSVASDFPVGAVSSPDTVADTLTAKILTVGYVNSPTGNTQVVYGAENAFAYNDYWALTLKSPRAIDARIDWFGSGNPYTGTGVNQVKFTDDLDLLVCSVAYACDESEFALSPAVLDLTGGAAASTSMPEEGVTGTLQPGTTVFIGILGFNAHYTVVYRLTVSVQ